MYVDDPASTLAGMLAAAEASMAQTAGGQSLCGLQKDGRVSGVVKYEEGRVAALMLLQRLLRQQSRTEFPLDPAAVLEQLLAEWQEELARMRRRATPASLWSAYRQGGVDALRAVHDAQAQDAARSWTAADQVRRGVQQEEPLGLTVPKGGRPG